MKLKQYLSPLWMLLFFVVSLAAIVTKAVATVTPSKPPTAVSVIKVKSFRWQPHIKETGTLIAEQGSVIKSEVAGRISEIFFRSGQTVKKGDPLVQLNPDVLKAQLKQYEAELNLNQMAFERNHGLVEKNFVSKADFDQALSNFKSSQAKVEGVKAELDQLLIRAPFSGKVGLQQVNVGDYVDAGTPIVNLQSVDPIYADFNIPEIYLSQVKLNESVTVTTTAYPSVKFHGKVVAMESLIDPDTRTLKVRAVLSNQDGRLIPGAFVEVSLATDQPRTVISVPQVALINPPDDENAMAVFVVRDQHAVLTKVEVLKQRNDDVLITSGLKSGDQVVIAGQMKLQDQAPVQIVP